MWVNLDFLTLHFHFWCEGVSKCQQSMLSCTEKGDFLLAQKHFLSGKWLCVTEEGEELPWTSADEPVTAEQCKGNDVKENNLFINKS